MLQIATFSLNVRVQISAGFLTSNSQMVIRGENKFLYRMVMQASMVNIKWMSLKLVVNTFAIAFVSFT